MIKIFLIGILTTFMACKPNSPSDVQPFANIIGPNDTANIVPPVNDDDDTNPDTDEFKLNCEEAKFVSLLNLYRAQNGLADVEVSKAGVLSTRFHAQDMINKNYFSHTEPSGRAFHIRAQAFNYPAWSENIAAGNTTASGTFCQWKNSAGHNTNMLQSNHRSIGIGRALGGSYGAYWSNNFGPMTQDLLNEPLTEEIGCLMPITLPNC